MMQGEAGLFQGAEILFFSLMWHLLGQYRWPCASTAMAVSAVHEMSRNVCPGASG